jgi:hypothetical protein
MPMTVAGCPVCGSHHAACGPATTVIGVDQNIVEAPAVGELREYAVVVNGFDTVMNLSEADAERLGGRPVAEPEAAPEAAPAKARTAPPNKARTSPRTT